MKTKDLLVGVFAVLLIASLGYLWLAPGGLEAMPEVSAKTLDGEAISLTELRGQPVLVTFWATTCKGCIREMPHLIDLYHELAPKGLEIVGIAMSYDPPNRVVAMRKARDIPYPIVLDIQDDISRAFGDVRLTPTSFLIAPDGRIVKRKTGEMDMVELRRQILHMVGDEESLS